MTIVSPRRDLLVIALLLAVALTAVLFLLLGATTPDAPPGLGNGDQTALAGASWSSVDPPQHGLPNLRLPVPVNASWS
jgi:hypothetical protein